MAAPNELDIEDRDQLQRYLQTQCSPASEHEIIEFEVLAGGVSGRTVRVKLSGGQEWVLKQALAKLRVQADWFSDPRRIHREAVALRVLKELAPGCSVPWLYFEDEQVHLIAMEAVERPHQNFKTMLLSGDFNPENLRDFGYVIAGIHQQSAPRVDLPARFDDRSYFESLRIEPYYEFVASKEPRAAIFYQRLISDTRDTRIALVHGDYSPKNILVTDHHMVLLDHEVVHWGDPTFDVGFALSHLLSKIHHVERHRDRLFKGTCSFWAAYVRLASVANLVKAEYEFRCVRHAVACILARVVGRSPLEYLTSEERDTQRVVALRLIQSVPRDVPELIERFVEEIDATKS